MYFSAGRQETAQLSELQQAQMLQDVNINPVQPSRSDTNLNIVTQGGPARTGFNEFTPLFERNRVQANVSVFGGSNDTIGGEAVVSGVYDWLSLSAGAFGYDTDGFRPNNDLNQKAYDFYVQGAINPSLNLQVEYQRRESDFGDLAMNFDLEDFAETERNSLETNTARIGMRFEPSANSTVLLLYNYKDRERQTDDELTLDFIPVPPGAPPVLQVFEGVSDQESDQFEGSVIYVAPLFNVIAGAAYAEVDREDTIRVTIFDPIFPDPIPLVDNKFDLDSTDTRGYAYVNAKLPASVTWTVGATYQRFDQDDSYSLDELQPKLGVVWNPTESLRLRGAYFEAMRPVLSSNRTLEPTQIAGFNQFFDEVNATRSTRYGLGIDWDLNRDVALGAEWTRRELKNAVSDAATGGVFFESRDEWTHRAYAYWTPSNRWALSAEAVYDKFENEEDSRLQSFVPERVRTVSVPLKATYFHPAGYFGGLGVTYVDQEVDRAANSGLAQGDSNFTVVDVSVGYRLPKRLGLLSLAVHNVFDEDFEYQDDSYREFADEPTLSPYVPERTLMARVVLNF
jgi:outer membrane receptor for ferrienterochelin and colicin